jgi:nanoRNase/pAp phosphatase (c-di-AMP/oligoRNAs hydrolase)
MINEKADEFDNIVKGKDKVYIFMHDFPDPDAMGASLGMKKLIEDRFEKTVLILGQGFSRPQNKVMANVLNIDLKNAQETLKGPTGINPGDMILFVDVNENSGNLAYKDAVKLKPDWTIDHHIDKDRPLGNTAHLEPVGSSCTIVAEYLQHFGIQFDEEKKQDVNVATALMLGLSTDTDDLHKVSVTPRDMAAFVYLKKYYSLEIFTSIKDFELNPYYYDLMAYAHQSHIKEGSLIVLNLGYINGDQEGALSFIAELWRRWKDVRVVIAFAIINNTVTGKVRVKGTGDIKASELARQVFQAPNGGGHDWMAGATAEFGPFFDTNLLDEEAKREFLHAITRIVVSRAKKLSQE